MIDRTTCPVQSLPCTYNWLKKKSLKIELGQENTCFHRKRRLREQA